MVTHHIQSITHALNLFDVERYKHCGVIMSWCSSCHIAFFMLLSYHVLLIATRGLAREQQEPLFEIGYAGFTNYHANVFFYQWEAPVRNATVCGRPCSSWPT